jgi:hypothetical protein
MNTDHHIYVHSIKNIKLRYVYLKNILENKEECSSNQEINNQEGVICEFMYTTVSFRCHETS